MHHTGEELSMSVINLFVAARSAIAEWHQRQRAYGELMSLDDRSLADIGIRREEIRAIVEGFHEDRRAPARESGSGAAPDPGEAWLAAGHR
jgi:uncharacterized protein YjiS (DUF1127 family)